MLSQLFRLGWLPDSAPPFNCLHSDPDTNLETVEKLSKCVRIQQIDPMVIGSCPPSVKLSLMMRESPALCNYRCMNHEVWSHQEEGLGHCLISNKLLSVHKQYKKGAIDY